ncbi:MFS transporter [Candidatus Anaplasma sp. TIGMIC]|uniref:MFS transporter n=1 Tax=Candidatus Anaplasma sp. TIGMIC TaxID=3020713 RepID=UPI00232EBC35|nr:MFS transporter [Candidatus Anaplasma sp. TIGMIC]MDB1135091.1 MFS transporter [Candidatus Anaplasma sp. TIGMIC]
MVFRLWKRITGLNEVVLSTLLCNAIEHYDFIVYGILSSTINKVFFAQENFFSGDDSAYMASLIGFFVFASAFMARPIGAIFFGYIGDKKGRRVALNASTLLLIGSVLGIAMLPTPPVWGIYSVVALTFLRVMQGLAYGAEIGGVVLMAESIDSMKIRIMWVARVTCCTVGMIVGVFVVKLCETFLSAENMGIWGWRIPFLVAALISLPLPKLRKFIRESTEYIKYRESGVEEKILNSLFHNIFSVLLITTTSALSAGYFYIFVVYMEISHKAMFFEYEISMTLLGMAAYTSLLVHDFTKRRYCFILILLFLAATAMPFTYYVREGYMIARVTYVAVSGIYLGWYGTFIALLFPVGARQTCFSVGYSMGYLVGALAPALCLWFYHTTGKDIMPGLYFTVLSLVAAVIFAFFVREEGGRYKLTYGSWR